MNDYSNADNLLAINLQKLFSQDGYLIVRSVFSASEITELKKACDELTEQAKSYHEDQFVGPTYFNLFRPCDPFDQKIKNTTAMSGTLRRVTYPYAINASVNRLRHNAVLLNTLQMFLGQDIVQIVNQINFNPPQIGTGWGWHQDYRFRRHGITELENNFIQCLTAIDASSSENGGFRLVPGSHKLGSLTLDLDIENAEKHFDARQAIVPHLEPGDTIFFNAYVIHGSTPNRSKNLRRVFINGYARASACQHGKPVMSNGNIIDDQEMIMEFEQDQAKLPLAAKY